MRSAQAVGPHTQMKMVTYRCQKNLVQTYRVCSCTAATKAILVKLAKMVIEFEYFATPWKIDAKNPIFVRFSIFVNFATLRGVCLL